MVMGWGLEGTQASPVDGIKCTHKHMREHKHKQRRAVSGVAAGVARAVGVLPRLRRLLGQRCVGMMVVVWVGVGVGGGGWLCVSWHLTLMF